MKTILIILGILICINFLVITISKAFADDIKTELKTEATLYQNTL